jgi:UDP-N-acetylmuramoyl-tripeptide--D-alanyl-D-alanine ligase
MPVIIAVAGDSIAIAQRRLVGPGDVVLVKGSNGSRVSRVVDALRNLGFEARQSARERD